MSYQVLARKWRPKTFAELVGQEHVKNTLINALTSGRLHHAYLFTGTRGVGKTTIARIFAKSLNCQAGIGAEPCGVCDACVSIEQGQFVDLIEIDAASRTKVEDTREILDNVPYAPTQGRYKVYLIDEAHMLSRHSFNALLKTLEEPPEHVKFLLATTESSKLPITVLSRCLQFNLTTIAKGQISEHLAYILRAEQINFEPETVNLLAKAAQGSLRDGLSLTDQAVALSQQQIRADEVRQMLGSIDQAWTLQLLGHIVNQNGKHALQCIDHIAKYAPNYVQIIDELLNYFHLAAMTQIVPNVAELEEESRAYIIRLAEKLSAQHIQVYYQILLNGKRDMEYASDERTGFEMLILRLLAFKPVTAVAAPSQQIDPLPVTAEQSVTKVNISGTSDASSQHQSLKKKQNSPHLTDDQQRIAALNQEQTAYLFAAEQQGFSHRSPDSAIDAHQNNLAAETSDVTNDSDTEGIDENSCSVTIETSGEPTYHPSESNLALNPSHQNIINQSDFQDPLLAILANRNITVDDRNTDQSTWLQTTSSIDSSILPSNNAHDRDELLTAKPTIQNNQQLSLDCQQKKPSLDPPLEGETLLSADKNKPSKGVVEPHTSLAEQPLAEQAETNDFAPKKASEIDPWSAIIEKMGISGLLRVFAVQATFQQQAQQVQLTVDEGQRHLDSPQLRQQLQLTLTEVLNQPIQLDIQFTNEELNSPFHIQRKIDTERLAAAKQYLCRDPLIVQLQQRFDAVLNEQSITLDSTV